MHGTTLGLSFFVFLCRLYRSSYFGCCRCCCCCLTRCLDASTLCVRYASNNGSSLFSLSLFCFFVFVFFYFSCWTALVFDTYLLRALFLVESYFSMRRICRRTLKGAHSTKLSNLLNLKKKKHCGTFICSLHTTYHTRRNMGSREPTAQQSFFSPCPCCCGRHRSTFARVLPMPAKMPTIQCIYAILQ